MKRILIILTLILTSCATQPKPYVSEYGSPFAPRFTEQQIEEYRLYMARELWCRLNSGIMKKRMTLQEMIDERYRVTEKLRKAIVEADMDMKEYSDLNDYYHLLDNKIRKKGKK